MIKTQIQLRPAQHRRLQELARRRRVSMAEAIRQSVDDVLSHTDRNAAWDRARACIGRYGSRKRQVSLTDWTSVEFMRSRSIAKVFAFDPQFRDQGFELLS